MNETQTSNSVVENIEVVEEEKKVEESGLKTESTESNTASTANANSVEDDFKALKNIDWVAESIIRLRHGKHPNPEIEALLARRMNFSQKHFLTPYPIRLLCTFGFCIVGCGTAWTTIWLIASIFEWHLFIRELSILMTTLLMALLGLAFSHPLKLFDENAIEQSGSEIIKQLHLQSLIDEQQTDQTDVTLKESKQ